VHQSGDSLVATARNVASLSYLPENERVQKLSLDVTDRKSISAAIHEAVANFGRIDVVVNNAGYGLLGDTESVPEQDARLQMETNFWGPVFITQEVLRVFRETNPPGQGGLICQISSMGGYLGVPGGAFYHAR
jgi:NAD(P)-dependent dehydrogenase (short-subunit alcohol dehydrogenase family)